MQLQTERAFTPPLLARMGGGDEPDPQNISHPSMTSFNQHSWADVTEQISAHPVGGLRFSSFRWALPHPFVYATGSMQAVAQQLCFLTLLPHVQSPCTCGIIILSCLGGFCRHCSLKCSARAKPFTHVSNKPSTAKTCMSHDLTVSSC